MGRKIETVRKDHAMNPMVKRLQAMEQRCERAEAAHRSLADAVAELRAQRAVLEHRLRRVERRGRLHGIAAAIAVAGALLFSPSERTAIAQGPPASLATLTNRIEALEAKTQFMRVSGGELFIENTNVHIRNGLGATNGNPSDPANPNNYRVNGLGNLIIGYQASHPLGNFRTGSHYLIVGDRHNYTRYGGILVGFSHVSTGAYGSVSGGIANRAEGHYSSLSGGSGNAANGHAASVTGGVVNFASGSYATVSGGTQNHAANEAAAISGGAFNLSIAFASSVSGGVQNTASGNYSTVSGGTARSATGSEDWVGGEYSSGS